MIKFATLMQGKIILVQIFFINDSSDHCFNYRKTDLCPKILCDKKYLALEMPICIFSLLVIWSNFDNIYPLWDLPLCIIYPRKTVILFDCMMDLAQCLSLDSMSLAIIGNYYTQYVFAIVEFQSYHINLAGF